MLIRRSCFGLGEDMSREEGVYILYNQMNCEKMNKKYKTTVDNSRNDNMMIILLIATNKDEGRI
jgi:hypothetical protein